MANLTENFGLKKPLPEEFYDVNVQNENMDIIDGALKTIPKKAKDIYAAPFGLSTGEYSTGYDGDTVEIILNKIYETVNWYEIRHFELDVIQDNLSLPVGFWFLKVYNNSHQLLVTATGYDETSGGIVELHRVNNGSWQPWEWVNPPMLYGVEYRTTERHNGKAVYVKAVNFGNLPNSTSKSVPVGIYPADVVKIDVTLYKSSAAISSPFVALDSFEIQSRCFIVSTGGLMMETKTDLSEYTAVAIIKYTK